MKKRPDLTETEAIKIAEKIRDEMIDGRRTKEICEDLGWTEGDLHWLRRKYQGVHDVISEGIKIRNDVAMMNIADKAEDLIEYIEEPSFKNRLDAFKVATAERKAFATHFDKGWVNKDAGAESGGPLQVIIRKFSDNNNDSE